MKLIAERSRWLLNYVTTVHHKMFDEQSSQLESVLSFLWNCVSFPVRLPQEITCNIFKAGGKNLTLGSLTFKWRCDINPQGADAGPNTAAGHRGPGGSAPVQVLSFLSDRRVPSRPTRPITRCQPRNKTAGGQKSKNEGFYSSSPSISMNNSSRFPSLRAFFNFPWSMKTQPSSTPTARGFRSVSYPTSIRARLWQDHTRPHDERCRPHFLKAEA